MVTYQETLGDSAPLLVAKLFGTTVSINILEFFIYYFYYDISENLCINSNIFWVLYNLSGLPRNEFKLG